VYHRRLPLGRIWVPLFSPLLYVAAVFASLAVRFVPRRVLEQHGQEMPVDPRLMGPYLRKMAWVLLCSGSYVLCDVNISASEEKVRVRVRTW
jgi:hypothetical protein